MSSLRPKGCFFNSPRQLGAREPERPLDLTAMPFLRAQMSRGWADTARVFWLCAKATNHSVSRLRVLVPECVTCFKASLENAAVVYRWYRIDFVCNTYQKHLFFYISFIQGEEINVHPWYLMLPAGMSCSFAFMLPVATPPNAIIFAGGHLKVKDMVCIDCNQRGFLLTTH